MTGMENKHKSDSWFRNLNKKELIEEYKILEDNYDTLNYFYDNTYKYNVDNIAIPDTYIPIEYICEWCRKNRRYKDFGDILIGDWKNLNKERDKNE